MSTIQPKSFDITGHCFQWTRTVSGIDSVVVRVSKRTNASHSKKSNLVWEVEGDNAVVPWQFNGIEFNSAGSGQLLVGEVLEDEGIGKAFNQKGNNFKVFPIEDSPEGWENFFQSEHLFQGCFNDLKTLKERINKEFPHPTLIFRPQGCTPIRFLNQVVSLLQSRVPDLLGWRIDKCRNLSFVDEKEIVPFPVSQWSYCGVQRISSLEYSYFFQRQTKGTNDLLELKKCLCGKSNKLIPEIKKYTFEGEVLQFHSIQATVNPASETISLQLELRTPSTPTFAPQPKYQLKGKLVEENGSCWKKSKNGDDLLWVELEDKEKTKILAFPRLQFPGLRGVYVPPQKDDKVIVTVANGGFPIADILTVKPGDAYEKPTVSVIGKSIQVEGTDSADVKSKHTKISEKLNVGKDVNVSGKLRVGKK